MTVHFDSWAAPGSAEDADAAQGEQLLALLEKARALLSEPGGDGDGEREAAGQTDANASDTGGGGGSRVNVTRDDATISAATLDSGRSAQAGAACSMASAHAGDRQAVHAGAAAPRRMKRYGKLMLVDLAGSERLKETGSACAAETGAINKSLFTLGQVLQALGERPVRGQRSQRVRSISIHCCHKRLCSCEGGSAALCNCVGCSPSCRLCCRWYELDYALQRKQRAADQLRKEDCVCNVVQSDAVSGCRCLSGTRRSPSCWRTAYRQLLRL